MVDADGTSVEVTAAEATGLAAAAGAFEAALEATGANGDTNEVASPANGDLGESPPPNGDFGESLPSPLNGDLGEDWP